MSYLPTPNSPLDRALTYLRTLPPGAEVSNALLAEVIKCPAKQNHSSFKAGIAAGLIYGRQKVPGGRSPVFWSLTDHSTPATTPATFPRSAFDAKPARVEGSGIRVREKRYQPFGHPFDSAHPDSWAGEASSPADGSQTPDGVAQFAASELAVDPAPVGSPATPTKRNGHDDESDGRCARGLAGGSNDGGPSGGRHEGGEHDHGAAEHDAGFLRPQLPRTAREGNADRARLISESPQQGDNRDLSAEQSHGAGESASSPGRGADGASACSASPDSESVHSLPIAHRGLSCSLGDDRPGSGDLTPASLNNGREQTKPVGGLPDHSAPELAPRKKGHIHPQPAAQQVLKAEAATPDATDRAAPAHASPGVGPMGVGQSADADPSGEPAPANTPWLHMRGIPWPVPVETGEPPLFTPQRHYLPSAPLFAGLEPDDRTAKQIIEDVAPQEAPRAERASTPPPVFHVSSDGEFRITRGGIETERLPWEHAVALFDFLRVRNLA